MDYEEFDVEVLRTISTTVRVRAKNAPSAALIVNQVTYPLPPPEEWKPVNWHYIVTELGSTVPLYEGNAEEFS